MNIEKLKECAELWEKYNSLHKELADVIQKIDEIDNIEDVGQESSWQQDTSDDELVMGSPFHRKLEATLKEWDIDRNELKDYFGITSMKYITQGQTRKVIENIEMYKDFINVRRWR